MRCTGEETDDVFHGEEVIVEKIIQVTGWRGNPSYAATLGLTTDENTIPSDGIISLIIATKFPVS